MSIGIKEYRELNKMTYNPKVVGSSLTPATKLISLQLSKL